MDPRDFLLDLFRAAVSAAAPATCLPPHLPAPPKGRTVVVGAGKAAAAMAKAVEDHWEGPLSGLVVTRYGHGVACSKIEVVEAGHPIPDEAGAAAAARILELVQGLSADDLVLFLGSGGGSALLTLPAPGITLQDKQALTRSLLKSGAAIGEINAVRKHLSAIKGGRIALAAAPARVLGLLICDVADGDPASIASGPTVPDPTTRDDARAVLARHGVAMPPNVARRLGDSAAETPKPGRPDFIRIKNIIVARAEDALAAAARAAEAAGVCHLVLGGALAGEASELAAGHARRALEISRGPGPFPFVLLSGGEATVTVTGGGRGGPNGEFLLALALALDSAPGIWALACDTDGIDGGEDNAGATIAPDTLARAAAMGLDARAMLARNDSYGFFEALKTLVRVGPTRTNVNDFRAVLIAPAAPGWRARSLPRPHPSDR